MLTHSRRHFLCAAAGLGSAIGAGLWYHQGRHSSTEHASSGLPNEPLMPLHTIRQRSAALGTEVEITVLHAQPDVGKAAIAAAFAELDKIEDLMSIYRPESQLCRLNRLGVLDAPHPYLVEVLRQAEAISQHTDGAFDITVQSLWRLYREAHLSQRMPTADEVAAARAHVDWRQVVIGDHQIRLGNDRARVTLNGIAQGFATDRVLAVLQSHGVCHALLNCGELAGLGEKDPGRPWVAGIQHPRRDDAYIAVAELDGRSLATSGDYASYFSPNYRTHHLFDPRTGRSANELASVSVAAPTGMLADALSTAVFVLGPERGLEVIQQFAGADAFLVTKDGRALRTSGFPLQQT